MSPCGFRCDRTHFALQSRVECRAAEAERVLVWSRWHTRDAKVVPGLPVSLKKQKTKAFAVHACGIANDGRQEGNVVVVSVSAAVFVDLPVEQPGAAVCQVESGSHPET